MSESKLMREKQALVLAKIYQSDKFIEWAIVKLYERQTEYEKAFGVTKMENKVGFSATGAKTGTAMAKWVIAARAKGYPKGGCLSVSQRFATRTILKKHTKQLVAILDAKRNTTPTLF